MENYESLIFALAFLLASVVLLVKNIKHIKSFCCSCDQDTSTKKDENVNELESVLNEMISNIDRLKQITPKIKEQNRSISKNLPV